MPGVHVTIPRDAIPAGCQKLPTKPRRHFQPHALQAPAPSTSVPSPIPKVSSPMSWLHQVQDAARRGPIPRRQPARPPGSCCLGTTTHQAPTYPHDLYLASFPHSASPFRPATSCASGHLGCGAPRVPSSSHRPHCEEKNMVATADLRERQHGRSHSWEGCMSNFRERESKQAN